MEDVDVREISRGSQITFTIRDRDCIGVVGRYLGDGVYEVVDEDDNEHELNVSEMTLDEE